MVVVACVQKVQQRALDGAVAVEAWWIDAVAEGRKVAY
jgi:hypothetical protein